MASRFEQFKKVANEIHNNKYDYSNFIYVNAKTAGTIICPEDGHGSFLQKPDLHTRKNAKGCPACVSLHKSLCGKYRTDLSNIKKEVPKEVYLQRLFDKYGDKFKFNLEGYLGVTKGTVTLICKDHGEENKSPQSLLISSYGCSKCARKSASIHKTKSFDSLMKDITNVHGDALQIKASSRDSYVDRKSILEVECPSHGVFRKRAQKLLSGQGCFKCRIEKLIREGRLPGGYGDEIFRDNPDLANKKAYLYYLKINSRIFKIGISLNVDNRLRGIASKSKGYIKTIEIIDVVETTLVKAFQLEQYLLDKHNLNRVFYRWSTELFNQDVIEGVSLNTLLKEMHTHTNTQQGTP